MKSRESTLRVAVVQLACHPAAYISFYMPMEEPIFEDRQKTLGVLGRFGFSVSELQQTCLEKYLAWHSGRLSAILQFLKSLIPAPDILVFPEYSIPWQCLPTIDDAISGTPTTVFAGTHTVQTIPDALKVYRQLGLDESKIRRYVRDTSTAILPILSADRAKVVPKRSLSQFEQTEVSPLLQPVPTLRPVRMGSANTSPSILAIICSEALQPHNISGNYSLAIVLSHQDKPEAFESFIHSQTRNHHPVAYCNDARYGGSGIFTVVDNRPVNWQNEVVQTMPPKEEVILIMDINMGSTTVQKGTDSPQRPTRLLHLGSIVYEEDMPGALEVSRALFDAPKIGNADARAATLSDLLSSGKGLQLQATRLEHLVSLAKRGTDAQDVWDALGKDCVVPGLSFAGMEGSLARHCYEQLAGNLGGGGEIKPDAAQALVQFLAQCQVVIKRSGGTINSVTAGSKRGVKGTIDREEEASTIVSFLDNRKMRLCQVLGREQIGKTVVLEKAFAQSALPVEVCRTVKLNESSTAEYLLASLVYGYERIPTGHPIELQSLYLRLPSAIKRFKLIVCENGEAILRGDSYRNTELESAVKGLIGALADCDCKLIILSRRSFPEGICEPSCVMKVWVYGFERSLLSYGTAYFDSQLRRVSLSPKDLDDNLKREFVTLLGGHPIALALAADNVFQDGAEYVITQLRARGGFWKLYVEQLIRTLDITPDEVMILRLVSGCQTPIAREVIQQCVPFAPQPAIRKLISLCLIDVLPDGRIWLSSLLRVNWHFTDLPEIVRTCFHRAAAEWYQHRSKETNELEYAIEAEYHANLGGIQLSITSGLLDAQISSAQTLYDQQDYQSAKDIINQVLRIKINRDTLRLAALIDSRCNDFGSAIDKARQVFSEDPSDTWFLDQIAKAALDVDRTDVVTTLVAIAKAAGAEDERVAMLEGRMLLRQHQLLLAIEAFEKARRSTRYNVWPFFYLGRTYMRLDDLDSAAEVLEDGLQFYDKHNCKMSRLRQMLRGLLAQTYIFQGADQAAAKLLDLEREYAHTNPEIARAIAMLSLKTEGIQHANEAFRRLKAPGMERRDDRCGFHLYYGMFLESIGELVGASEQYNLAHKAVFNNVFVLMQLAKVLMKLAQKASQEGPWLGEELTALAYAKRCAETVRKIIELSPRNGGAKNLQEELYGRFNVQ